MKGAKFIFFDTETTGLPINWKAPVSQVANWPRMIQLGVLVYTVDQDGAPQLMDENEFLIKPDGWQVPKEKFWIDNGFDHEKSLAEGVPVVEALDYFIGWANEADFLVAHNMSFDQAVLGAEMIRAGKRAEKQLKKVCTKIEGTPICHLPAPSGKGLKWPKLEELHLMLFGESFEGAHGAINDVKATANCFWEMVKRGFIQL